MTWSDYIVAVAAPHSKGSAQHWFRYLRKDIDKYGVLFTEDDIKMLCNNETLTPFQRISLKAAFLEDSPTREHIISLNNRAIPNKLSMLREKYGDK